jgi:hypothetical protein
MSIVLVGSTSGSVTLQEPAVAGTTVLTLPAVSGTVLTDTSPKAGNVLQVVSATYATQTSSSSGSTWVDTGLSVTITPTSSSSKILVLVAATGLRKVATTNAGVAVGLRVLRGATQIVDVGLDNSSTETTANGGQSTTSSSTCYLDSPATTSATTYKLQFNNARGVSDLVYICIANCTSVITLMEIAA